MELGEDTFGNRGRVREYKILFYLGLGMLAVGVPLLFFGNTGFVAGILLIFFGLMCAITGWLGLGEEKKKFGVKRKSTTAGIAALIFGIISVFASSRPYLSLIAGPVAIILAYKSVKDGDNEYGLAGGICGVIGIIVNIFVMILFNFFM